MRRVETRTHEVKHEPVTLLRERFDLLSEEYDTVFIFAEERSRHALHRHIKPAPRPSMNLRRGSLPYFFSQLNLSINCKIWGKIQFFLMGAEKEDRK